MRTSLSVIISIICIYDDIDANLEMDFMMLSIYVGSMMMMMYADLMMMIYVCVDMMIIIYVQII
jgi:hypothetical protein